ncbi:MAG: homocitrate synthase family protein [Methanosarcina sp.]|jgi:methanogen homocitrate synthase|nr:homocitrate synthase family protein [Methanosarcina sp.]MDD3317169.1 homocitrate synthase family protein [Methanosarcina sp.]MDD4306042.1 homocitrate synthase family protein [Methanosarcina sp.]MDD4620404.1 homocitrate synthase family protein [Methanosarcina sp.]NLN43286.1 homoaconitate hydratase [Methanosarcina sp.]
MSESEQYSRNKLMDFIEYRPLDIEICDVTLRDGEQTPGIVFTKEQKLAIASELDSMGVEVIEAGFPVVSANEKEIVKEIASQGFNSRICCLSRAVKGDVDAAIECDVDIVSIFIAMSDLHLKYKYHRSFEEMLGCAKETIEYATDHGLKVRFAAEDASRTPIDRLKKAFKETENEYKVQYVSLADTIGILNPTTTHYLVSEIYKAINTSICIHCHNDLGMATANTLAAAEAGAKQLHTTVNAIGERAGNASLEEVMVALRVQYGIDRYDTTKLTALSKMVSEYSGITPSVNKAVVGQNAFTHESGIHVAAILEEPRTYELFLPEMVGGKRNLVVGKHTGTKALKGIIDSIGFCLERDELCALIEKVKVCTEEKHKSISREQLERLISQVKQEQKVTEKREEKFSI